MPGVRRHFVAGLTAMVCLWLCVFHLYGYGVRDYISDISMLNALNQSGELRGELRSNACPSNKYKEHFVSVLYHWHILAGLYRIPYTIGCGSLLGQYRDQDIIPWDEDVDVLVDIKSFKQLKAFGGKRNFEQGDDEKFHFVVQQDFERREDDRRRLSCIGEIVDSQIDSCSFVSPMARVIQSWYHLDIFPYIVDGDKQVVRDQDMQKDYKMNDFFPIKRCTFMNVKTWCPQNVRGVLEAAYDDLEPDYSCVNRTWVSNGS